MRAPLALQHIGTVYAAAPTAPGKTIDNFAISAAIGTILATLVLVFLVGILGRILPFNKKWDNLVCVVLALFGITGMLATINPFSGWRRAIHDTIVGGATQAAQHSSNVGAITTVIIILVALIGAYAYGSKGSPGALLLFVLFTLPLFLNATMYSISLWYLSHIGQPVFSFIAGLFRSHLH